jgi:hypothetical protein
VGNLKYQTEVDFNQKFDIDLLKKIFDDQAEANLRKSADNRDLNSPQ